MTACLFSLYAAKGIEGGRPIVGTDSTLKPMEKIEFKSDYQEGLRLGAAEGKPILLFFMENDCPFSRWALKEIFSKEAVIDLSRRFVCVEIDVSQAGSESIMKTYGVTGSPTVQFVSARGDALQQIDKLSSPEEFKKQMEVVLYSIAWRQPTGLLR